MQSSRDNLSNFYVCFSLFFPSVILVTTRPAMSQPTCYSHNGGVTYLRLNVFIFCILLFRACWYNGKYMQREDKWVPELHKRAEWMNVTKQNYLFCLNYVWMGCAVSDCKEIKSFPGSAMQCNAFECECNKSALSHSTVYRMEWVINALTMWS